MVESIETASPDKPSANPRAPAGYRIPPPRRGFLARRFYGFSLFLSRLAGLLFFNIRWYGHRWSVQGGAVVASNHISFLDPWLVGMSIPRHMYYLARDNLYRWPIFGRILYGLNTLPIPRGAVSSRHALEAARQVVGGGHAIVLFPEGTRSRTGRMGPMKRGVDLITRPSRSPIVPAFVDGSYEAWPPDRPLPRILPVRVIFGAPLEWQPRGGRGKDGASENPESSESSREVSADVLARLSAAYRSLAAQAHRVRWVGATGWRRWLHQQWSF